MAVFYTVPVHFQDCWKECDVSFPRSSIQDLKKLRNCSSHHWPEAQIASQCKQVDRKSLVPSIKGKGKLHSFKPMSNVLHFLFSELGSEPAKSCFPSRICAARWVPREDRVLLPLFPVHGIGTTLSECSGIFEARFTPNGGKFVYMSRKLSLTQLRTKYAANMCLE